MLLALAVWLQLADPRETEISGEVFLSRLATLHDAPPIQAVYRLPPPFVADAYSDFAWEHLNWLQAKWMMEPDLYGAALTEQRQYVAFWQAVRFAQGAGNLHERRTSLKEVRFLVGQHAWIHCDWPGPAPRWKDSP